MNKSAIFAIVTVIVLVCLFLVYPVLFIDFPIEKKAYPSLGINKKIQSSIDYNSHIWMEGNTIYGSVKLRKENNQVVDTVIKLYRFVTVVGSSNPSILLKDKFLSGNSEDSTYYKSGLKIESFLIGTTEVSNVFWHIFKNRGSDLIYDESSAFYVLFPQCNLKYEECVSFLEELSSVLKRKFRLPTFHEWLFAASGGVKSKGYIYSGSNDINKVAWYKLNLISGLSQSFPPGYTGHPIANKLPNELDIYDMSGNVKEFTSTIYGDFYSEIGLGILNSFLLRNFQDIHTPITMGGDTNSDSDGCRIDLFPSGTSSLAGFRIIMEP